MKKPILAALALCYALGAAAQTPDTAAPEGYRFTDVKILPVTPVKDQSRSGTCWCYSTLSFLESEILRAGGPELDLSEMWIVRNIYFEKAVKYVRMHGEINFAEGGASHDVTEGIKNHGIVPQEAYPGFNYGTEKADFHELSRVLKAYLDAVMEASTKSSNKPLSTAWKRGFNAILDEYFGPMPETFTYQGKEYTPRTFADSLPIDIDDYIDISSFTHHPFYTQFIIEVPGLQPSARRNDGRRGQCTGKRVSRRVGHRRKRKGIQPHQGDRYRTGRRPRRHGRHRSRALGKTDPEGEG